MPIDLLSRYFPDLPKEKLEKFRLMESLYLEWNERINVISRKDTVNLTEHHILHSLSIAKFFKFTNGTRIIDIGTGGGFPGLPLALIFNQCHFTLIDSIGKKIHVVKEIAEVLDIKNVSAIQIRSEHLKGNFDYIVSRAVTNLPSFINQTKHLIKNGKGIIYLKGGDFNEELKNIRFKYTLYPISDFFHEAFFETKQIIWLKKS